MNFGNGEKWRKTKLGATEACVAQLPMADNVIHSRNLMSHLHRQLNSDFILPSIFHYDYTDV